MVLIYVYFEWIDTMGVQTPVMQIKDFVIKRYFIKQKLFEKKSDYHAQNTFENIMVFKSTSIKYIHKIQIHQFVPFALLFVLYKIGSQLNLSNLSSLCDLEKICPY